MPAFDAVEVGLHRGEGIPKERRNLLVIPIEEAKPPLTHKSHPAILT